MAKLIIVSGDAQGQQFDLDQEVMVVGRDPQCQVVLESPEVSRRHAELRQGPEGIVVKDLGSTNGTLVGGREIDEKLLAHGDEIVFGGVKVRLHAPSAAGAREPARAAGPVPPDARLVGADGRSIRLGNHLILVGREPGCDLVINLESVSARHAELRATPQGVLVKDLGSTNGTFVNGRKVSEKLLAHGDEVAFDVVKFRVWMPTADEGAAGPDAVPPAGDGAGRTTGRWLVVLAALIIAAGLLAWWWLRPSPDTVKPPVPARPAAGPLTLGRLWSLTTGGSVLSSPAVGDVDGNGVLDVVVGCQDGKVYAVNGKTGRLLWAALAGGQVLSSPAMADLTGDGVLDVVVGTNAARVLALNGTARPAGTSRKIWEGPSGLARNSGVTFRASPALTGPAGGGVDVVIGASNGRLYRLRGAGGKKAWDTGDKLGTAGIYATAVLADVNGDGVLDALVGSNNGRFYCVDGAAGRVLWSLATGGPIKASACLADFERDGKKEVIIAGTDGTVYVCRADDGCELWRLATGGVIQASPVVIDYNRDGVPDPVVALVGGEVLCLDGRGRGRGPVWRYATGAVGGVLSSPLVYDFNGDGVQDVLVVDRTQALHVINGANGKKLLRHKLTAGSVATPALADVNGDGRLEVILGTVDNRVVALSFNRTVDKNQVISGLFRSNLRRTGN